MSDITIRTNNTPRAILYWEHLTAKQRDDFDYIDTSQRKDDAEFFEYHGVLYDLHEFSSLRNTGTPQFKQWDGYLSDTYFSGVLIRWSSDHESVVCATFSA
jgi:hypothetical protein